MRGFCACDEALSFNPDRDWSCRSCNSYGVSQKQAQWNWSKLERPAGRSTRDDPCRVVFCLRIPGGIAKNSTAFAQTAARRIVS